MNGQHGFECRCLTLIIFLVFKSLIAKSFNARKDVYKVQSIRFRQLLVAYFQTSKLLYLSPEYGLIYVTEQVERLSMVACLHCFFLWSSSRLQSWSILIFICHQNDFPSLFTKNSPAYTVYANHLTIFDISSF